MKMKCSADAGFGRFLLIWHQLSILLLVRKAYDCDTFNSNMYITLTECNICSNGIVHFVQILKDLKSMEAHIKIRIPIRC